MIKIKHYGKLNFLAKLPALIGYLGGMRIFGNHFNSCNRPSYLMQTQHHVQEPQISAYRTTSSIKGLQGQALAQQLKAQAKIKQYRGKLHWVGNLEEMRTDRVL